MPMETVTFTKVVPIATADGKPICEGDVLIQIKDGERGVVKRIMRAGDRGTVFDQIGDIKIQTSRGCTRVTNQYDQWRHIPHKEQTYEERFESWLVRKYDHDDYRQCSEDEGLAVDGIMALLPDDIVDWDYGPFPDRIEDALRFLKNHLEELSK